MPTIGVSIAVPDPEGSALQEYRVALGDDTARHIPTHITLVPPTEVADEAMPVIEKHLSAAAARHRPFRVSLRGTGTFRPVSPVVFIGVVEGISSCELLADTVRTGPLAVEVRFPYHPHVTVAHHLGEEQLDRAFEELAGYEAGFAVDAFWLYVHDEHHGWRPTRSFRLGT
ncbi:MAG: 2'-5' RNA ligase family protein [Nocardioidaceae bacterium]|nr:2'-5' RNA ligase family protein [Nocardioidaceae bacterium]